MSVVAERLAIVGVGLIGGSLAAAVRERSVAAEVVGCGRSTANLEVARRRGLVDRTTTSLAEAVAGADVIVLAVPIGTTAALAAQAAAHAPPGAVLSDVGSVKAPVVSELETVWPRAERVVGAHPIAGSERGGAAAARANLFERRRCIVTPTERTGADALARIEALWRGVGAEVERMDPARHDAILAWVSHAPHAIAYALAEAVARAEPHGALLDYAGSGFQDMTRIARSSPGLWRDVLLANAGAVRRALDGFRIVLDEIEAAIDAGEGEALVALLGAAAGRLREAPRRG